MLLRLPSTRQQKRFFLGRLLEKAQQGGGGSNSRQQRWQKVVQHPVSTIYRAVAEVEQYSSFLPWCTNSSVIDHSLDIGGAGELKTDITVGFRSLTASFNSTVHLTPLQRIHAESEPNDYIDHLRFTWEFGEIGERVTRCDLTLDFSLRNAEHILMWELAHDKIIGEYVRCFSKRCATLEQADAEADASFRRP